ncbi:MAG: di-trans,poly-cis-decaprenylcistransferase [Oscillospiraceae bacterium]|nr:di-trans,poly-cis-decaprenylcistransferase [Oscillospiraceae bacterium]MBR3023158.1 di-trans,poly-cis-decaprenylcistransferase [Oscillospiraceae bacterium]MBR3534871.1 di-trans,poly-cis-decaprenylcistransferase [Oscillospiraceae bacterium]MBR6836840.1 di-trans,poly-cis-decaprenylcistransferase [Oscillospiraceae bacterium]
MATKDNNKRDLPEILPEHIGFIMDGNGRWAKKRMMPRTFGHAEGGKTFEKIVRYCRDIGIKYISFYAFSTENWKRSSDEISALMVLFKQYLAKVQNYYKEEVRMVFIGDRTAFAPELIELMNKVENDTKDYDKMTMIVALNYGGRDEIRNAAKKIAASVQKGELSIDDITEQTVADNLYTKGIPDVDLLIRPSGELRTSNFLIWQCAYAELYFSDVLWPDFLPDELDKALWAYAGRQRRFGGV